MNQFTIPNLIMCNSKAIILLESLFFANYQPVFIFQIETLSIYLD